MQKKCLISGEEIRNVRNKRAVHLGIVVFLAMKKRCALHIVRYTVYTRVEPEPSANDVTPRDINERRKTGTNQNEGSHWLDDKEDRGNDGVVDDKSKL